MTSFVRLSVTASLCSLVGALVCGVAWGPSEALAKRRAAELQLLPSACSPAVCRVSGRLVRKSRWIKRGKVKKGRFRSFMKAFRRLTRKGMGQTPVQLTLGGQSKLVVTDNRGYFAATFRRPALAGVGGDAAPASRPAPTSAPASQPVGPNAPLRVVPAKWPSLFATSGQVAALTKAPGVGMFSAAAKHEMTSHVAPVQPASGILVYPAHAGGVSVISDIDDTLIKTYVTRKRKLVGTFLFKNYAQIKVVPGALAFVKSLLKGPDGRGGGALHYVTGSPARIFDRVYGLFRLRGFPMGSFHMKRLSGPSSHGLSKQLAYKLSHIKPLFQMYPKRRFVLIGDSGEKDPAIYKRAKALFPKQVAAVYIRHVSKDSPKALRYRGVTLIKTYAEAMRDARRRGLIR